MQIPARIKPASGFSHFVHIFFLLLLPALLLVLVRLGFVQVALALILLSKWRMFAVKPRHWLASFRANAVDITVGLSVLAFMSNTNSQIIQLAWAVAYAFWLTIIKPRSNLFMISVQALTAQTLGLIALFLNFGGNSTWLLIVLGWFVCYMSARHFFTNFDEPLSSFLSNIWGFFAASLVWVSAHWLLFYGFLAQPALLLTVIGTGLAGAYYLDKTDRLSTAIRRQIVIVVLMVIVVVLAFSNWSNKVV